MTQRTALIWTFAISSVALFMTTLDNLVVTTALPVIHKDLHASLSGLEWTVNAYTLTFAVLLITGAALGDRFGRRRMFVVGLSIFTAGSAAADPPVKIARPITNILRRPKRSPSAAPVISSTAKVKV